MTKSFKKISMESLHGLDYSNVTVKQSPECTETPVLDLSCKKLLSPSLTSNYVKDSIISPLRGSGYQYHHEETSTFSSSNHERKSPFESRTYVMTPPSESDSPKKSRFQPIYDHTNLSGSETRINSSYPMIPINLPSVPMPLSVPSVVPPLLSQSSPPPVSQIQIPTSSTSHETSQPNTSTDDSKKAPRPFKAYPKDPLSITLGPDMMFDQELKKAYSDFRNRMLDSVKRTNEGTNIKMRRISKSPMLPTSTADEKDAAYWERRRKNNEAAKRSRDARRAKEDEIAIRAAFLEQEYIRLKYENAVLKDENTKIKCMLYGC